MERASDELGEYGATEKHQAIKSLRRRRIDIQAGEKRPRDLVLWTRQGPADEAALLCPAGGRVGDRTAVLVGGELWTANLASGSIGLPIALIASSRTQLL